MFHKISVIQKFLDKRWLGRAGLSNASAISSCLTLPRNFVRVSFCVSQSLWLRITLWLREGGGEGGFIKTFWKKFLSHTAEKFRRETLLCFGKFLISKKNIDGKDGYHDSPSKLFCLTVVIDFAGEAIKVSLVSGIKNFLLKRCLSRFSDLLSICYVSQFGKNFVVESFCVSHSFWYRKFLWIRKGAGNEGLSTLSVKSFCLTLPEVFLEEPFCGSEKVWYREKLRISKGGVTMFR